MHSHLMEIELADLFDENSLRNTRVHLATSNDGISPLDFFVTDNSLWHNWFESIGEKKDFQNGNIFSLIEFYPEKNTWLFGGIYRIKETFTTGYTVELTPHHKALIGRLKVGYTRKVSRRSVPIDRYFQDMTASEILKQPYSGEEFPGYENISLPFSKLRDLVKNRPSDWVAALSNVKGVYLIADRKTGQKYVGAAYGSTGIWARWESYIKSGHGKNVGLAAATKDFGLEYATKHFQFTLLEYRSMKTDDKAVIAREGFWKKSLLTRGKHGYNKN